MEFPTPYVWIGSKSTRDLQNTEIPARTSADLRWLMLHHINLTLQAGDKLQITAEFGFDRPGLYPACPVPKVYITKGHHPYSPDNKQGLPTGNGDVLERAAEKNIPIKLLSNGSGTNMVRGGENVDPDDPNKIISGGNINHHTQSRYCQYDITDPDFVGEVALITIAKAENSQNKDHVIAKGNHSNLVVNVFRPLVASMLE